MDSGLSVIFLNLLSLGLGWLRSIWKEDLRDLEALLLRALWMISKGASVLASPYAYINKIIKPREGRLDHLKRSSTQVMLSQPTPSLGSAASSWSSSLSSAPFSSGFCESRVRRTSISPWLFYTYFSQMPSQPIMMNSSCPGLR